MYLSRCYNPKASKEIVYANPEFEFFSKKNDMYCLFLDVEMKSEIFRVVFESEGNSCRYSGLVHKSKVPHFYDTFERSSGSCAIFNSGIECGDEKVVNDDLFDRDKKLCIILELEFEKEIFDESASSATSSSAAAVDFASSTISSTSSTISSNSTSSTVASISSLSSLLVKRDENVDKYRGKLHFFVNGKQLLHTITRIPRGVHFMFGLSKDIRVEVTSFQRLYRPTANNDFIENKDYEWK